MKKYQKTFKTIMTSGFFLTFLLTSNFVMAQAAGGGPTGGSTDDSTGDPVTDHRLYRLYYDDRVLQDAGCAKPVWEEMNRVFIAKRTLEGEMENAVMVKEQMAKTPRTSPPRGKGSCFDQALNSINSAASKIKALLAIIGGGVGGLDFGSLSDQLMGQLTIAITTPSCSEIYNLIGAIAPTIINNRLGGINGTINNPGSLIGTGINGINGINGTKVPIPRLPTANNPNNPFAP